MDIWKDILAALSGVLNALPQGLLAMTFGFASIPTALAFLVGAVGSAATSNVAVISYQAETITLAGTMGKSMRERLSMIFFGGAILTTIGLFGVLEDLIDWIGPVITTGMMAGVGIMLTKVAWGMALKDKISGISSTVVAILVYFATKDLVYTITASVILATIIHFFTKKETDDTPDKAVAKEGFFRQKLLFNTSVIRGALALVCLNIGANIAFGKINETIASKAVNVDHLTIISSLADMVSSFFGGAPVEIVISATASAPHAVWAGVLMMVLMAIILATGLMPKIGKFVPSSSIAGFLFVLGSIVTLPPNAAMALTGTGAGSSVVGAVTMVVTSISDPFFGMLSGVIVQFLISLFGF